MGVGGRKGVPGEGTLELPKWGAEKHFRQREHMEGPSGKRECNTFKHCPQTEPGGEFGAR